MRSSRRLFLVAAGGWTIGSVADSLWGQKVDRVSWHTDLVVAHRRCIAEKRAMLLFVTTDGCPYCLKMMQSTYVEAGIAKEASNTFVLTMVNGAEQADVVEKIGVRIYPTTYIFDPTHGVIDRIEGFVPADQLRKRLAVASQRLAQAMPRRTR